MELDILDIFATQPILQKEGTSLTCWIFDSLQLFIERQFSSVKSSLMTGPASWTPLSYLNWFAFIDAHLQNLPREESQQKSCQL